MPSCAFCGGKVLPCNATEGKPPVCSKCRGVLDEYMESRAVEYMQDKLKEDLPGMLTETLSNWNGRSFVVKFEDRWNKKLGEQVKAIVAESLSEMIRWEVEDALKAGIASLAAGSRPLAKGKKREAKAE